MHANAALTTRGRLILVERITSADLSPMWPRDGRLT